MSDNLRRVCEALSELADTAARAIDHDDLFLERALGLDDFDAATLAEALGGSDVLAALLLGMRLQRHLDQQAVA